MELPKWLKDCWTVDLESLKIRDRPDFPPSPVGLAMRSPKGKSEYLAWGHMAGGGNSCGWEAARRRWAEMLESGRPILTHNGGKFDIEVAAETLSLPAPRWDLVHDTLPMLFLKDPRAETFSLKPSSERLLGLPPEERDAVVDWLVQHQPIPGVTLTDNPRSKSKKGTTEYAGDYIAHAPVDLVGRYAISDVDRTWRMAGPLWEELTARGMIAAYDRERRVYPVIREMEQQGVRVDLARLERDVETYNLAFERLDSWIRKTLRRPGMNVDSGEELVEAMLACGKADLARLGVTEKEKKPQTNQEAIERGVSDPQLKAVLAYRAQLSTCLKTFLRPWLVMARRSGGLIYTSWNSTRQDKGKGLVGARSGRFSSTPNFQNIPLEFDLLFRHMAEAWLRANEGHEDFAKVKASLRGLPTAPFELPNLPQVRSYIVPLEKGHVLLGRDYSGQELRVFAHFEDGETLEEYRRDPWFDLHAKQQRMINLRLGRAYGRKPIKTMGFGIMYGMGRKLLFDMAHLESLREAGEVKEAYLKELPGLADMYKNCKKLAKAGLPIRTWGGREYFCEPPKLIDGELRRFDYKLPNLLIQGSSADCTKEALIRLHEAKPKEMRIILQVHDEVVTSAPREMLEECMALQREKMESVEFDVPMLSEGEVGLDWGHMTSYDTKGKIDFNPKELEAA